MTHKHTCATCGISYFCDCGDPTLVFKECSRCKNAPERKVKEKNESTND